MRAGRDGAEMQFSQLILKHVMHLLSDCDAIKLC
jgi:hypothetical protein